MPNSFAYIVLFSWPVVTAIIFSQLSVERAAAVSIIAGYLLLPSSTAFDVHFLPPLNKASIVVLSALLMCVIKGPRASSSRAGGAILLLLFAFVAAPIATTFGNSYELRLPGVSFPGYYLSDGIKTSIRNLIEASAFYIGLRFVSSADGRSALLQTMAASALLYSLPMLAEMRLSPQLHKWIYGFFPAAFHEVMRWGGYRPVVFMQHGLQLAIFITMALLATCVLARLKWKIFGIPRWATFGYLFCLLLICKSVGAVIYAAVLVPVVLFLRPRTSVTIACGLMLFVCAYPLLRASDYTPIKTVMRSAQAVSQDRATSFNTRVTSEEKLLAKAQEKPMFGWGGWGRNRVIDPNSGRDVTITDGGWIIAFGAFGWLGYLSLFGLLTAPVLRMRSRIRGASELEARTAAGLCVLLTANVIDMIPNENLSPITLLLAGSIAGFQRAKAGKAIRPRLEQVEMESTANLPQSASPSGRTSAGSAPQRV